jgi:excisionase family DNA binding protein
MLLTVREASELLRVHPETILRMIRRGDLPAIKCGTVYRISTDDLRPQRAVVTRTEVVDESPLAKFVRPEWRHPDRVGR